MTTTAWIFIVLSGFGTFMTCSQNVFLWFMFSNSSFRAEMSDAGQRWALTFIPLWFAFAFIMNAATLISSIGLLRRRNWARKLFLGIIGFAAIWCILGGIGHLGFLVMLLMGATDVSNDFAISISFIAAITIAFCAVVSGLLIWTMRTLMREDIRAEFRTPNSTDA